MAFIDSWVESNDVPPLHVEMTIIAQDPAVKGRDGRVLTAKVRVPASRLERGPRTARFHVVDYDSTEGVLGAAADLCAVVDGRAGYVDRFDKAPDAQLLDDPDFHAQNAYAIAARTLAVFESALGRRLPWGFGGHQLYIVPHAFAEANAYYSDDDRAVLFGYVDGGRGERRVYTCLSHDVVAHETAHAVLDGLRHRFLEPGLPDQAAFHEALADLVALFSVFSLEEVVARLLGGSPDGRLSEAETSAEVLRENALLKMAEQIGQVLTQGRGALRESGRRHIDESWASDVAFEEPHLRGEVVVGAFLDVLLEIWLERLLALRREDGSVDRARAAEEGAKAAGHLLTMAVRAIDYLPPVEFEFVDFLDAMLTSDAEVAPDDRYGYRKKIRAAFAARGIAPSPPGRVVDLTRGDFIPLYHGLNFGAMRTDPDEVFRFMWENADALGLVTDYYTRVDSVRPSVRVGPDGLVVNEAVADYTQQLDLTAGEFAAMTGTDLPADLDPDTKLTLFGGGTLVFDQFGRAKYHIRKPLDDWRRQADRLAYLVRAGIVDTKGKFGSSTGAPLGQRFALLHDPGGQAGEVW